ncbi:tail fiber domain-containing protein [Sinorhizobium meliloti]
MAFSPNAETVYADGPFGSPLQPSKPEIRSLLAQYEAAIEAYSSGAGSIAKSTRALLFADLAHAADVTAWVYADSTVAYNGIYRKSGSSGAGSWTLILPLPFSFIIASDAGAGTPNAIQATTSIPVSSSALVMLNIFEANTASPVTVSFNGGSPLTIKTNSGNEVAAGGFVAGMIVLGIVSGSTFRLVSDQVSAAIVAQAEAYANAAAAAANAGFLFDTEADFENASIPAPLQFVRTAGYYAPGDGGGHLKQRIATPGVVKPWHKQSADGAWWQISAGQDIHVEMFGAKSFTEAQVAVINGGPEIKGDEQLLGTQAAFQAADDFMFEVKGGGTFYGRGQNYFFPGWEYNTGVYFDGAGHGKWMPSFPTEAKTWEGTNLIATGVAGKATYTVHGINSAELSGGWRESLDTPGRFFKLTSLMNRDAAGNTSATPRALKVFIRNKARHGDKGGILNCRIVPFIGSDGIATYSTQVGNDLGEAWDIGFLVDTMEGVYVSGVQARGYWRIAGMAELSPDWTNWSRSEANVFINSSATGMVGLLLRSSQQWRVLSVNTANPADMQVTIPWDIENPWDPTGGQVNLNTAGGYCTYTSIERSGANLIFHGLSEDPTGATLVRAPYRGTGFSTGTFMNFEAWALWHHSGQKAEALGLGRPSTGFECSGFPMRGVNFYNFSAFGEDSVSPAMHLHNCFDFNFFGGKAEVGIVLASTIEANQALPATATGNTGNIGLHGFQFTSSIDFRHGYWQPRSQRNLQEQWTPLGELSTDMFILKAMENQEFRLKMAAGKNFRVVNSDNSFPFTVFSSGNTTIGGSLTLGSTSTGLLSSVSGQSLALREGTTTRLQVTATSGSVTPGADNTQNLGTGSLRWAQLFAGTATINTSDERLKREIEVIAEAVLDAWRDVEWFQYRFTDGNRLHFGLVAQRVQAALAAHGLDAFELGLLCYDQWDDQFEEVYEEREVLTPRLDEQGSTVGWDRDIVTEATGEKRLVTPAGNRYGLRYEECFAVEAAYQRREIERLKTAIAA